MSRSTEVWARVWHWIWKEPRNAWLVLIVLAAIIRLPYLLDDRQVDDESYYSAVGIEVLKGGQPYVAAVDRKPPLLFYSYAAFFGLVGEYNFVGLHALSFLWALGTMAVAFLIARRLFDWRCGVVAAFFYAVFQPGADYRNQAMNGEMLMNLPILLALWVLLRTSTHKIRLELILSGALLAVAFLYKQPAAIAAVPIGLYLLLPNYRRERAVRLGESFANVGLFAAGFTTVLGVVVWHLHAAGILEAALFWTSQTDFVHGPSDPVFWRTALVNTTLYFLLPMAPLIACVVASMGGQARATLWRGLEPEYQGLVWLLLFSAIGACASGRFASHHYIQLLPAMVLLAAPIPQAILEGRLRYRFVLLKPKVLIGSLGVLFVGFCIAQAVAFEVRFQGGAAPDYVRGVTHPEDGIFVWGPSPDFYLDAHRGAATRFVSTFPLTGYIFGSPLTWDPDHDPSARIHPGSWALLAADLAASRPTVVVDEFSHRGGGKYALANYPELVSLIERDYSLIRVFPEARVYMRSSD